MLKSKKYENWPMHSGEMMQELGLKSGGHLPAEGMPERTINGVTIYVLPAEPSTGRKSSKHRVMAICPVCNRHMSAGRLNQHARLMHKT